MDALKIEKPEVRPRDTRWRHVCCAPATARGRGDVSSPSPSRRPRGSFCRRHLSPFGGLRLPLASPHQGPARRGSCRRGKAPADAAGDARRGSWLHRVLANRGQVFRKLNSSSLRSQSRGGSARAAGGAQGRTPLPRGIQSNWRPLVLKSFMLSLQLPLCLLTPQSWQLLMRSGKEHLPAFPAQ